MGEFVRVEKADGVATIRLDRPKMNALNRQVQLEIAECARQVDADGDVSAVVVYGGRVFAAGADIKEMADMSYADMAVHSRTLQDCFTAVARVGKPVVAAVTGYALGGGCELALCADIRIAGESAKLGQPEVLLGLIPGAGAPSGCPGSSARPRPRTSSSPDATWPPTRRWPSAWWTGWSPTMTCTPRPSRTRPSSPEGGPGAARRQAGGRPRPGDRSGHRSGDRTPAVLRHVRHRRRRDRHARLLREVEGRVHRTLRHSPGLLGSVMGD